MVLMFEMMMMMMAEWVDCELREKGDAEPDERASLSATVFSLLMNGGLHTTSHIRPTDTHQPSTKELSLMVRKRSRIGKIMCFTKTARLGMDFPHFFNGLPSFPLCLLCSVVVEWDFLIICTVYHPRLFVVFGAGIWKMEVLSRCVRSDPNLALA